MHRAPQLKRRLTAAFTGRLCGNAGSTLRPRAKCRSFSHCSWQARDSRGGARGGHAARGMPQVLGAALALGGVVGLATAADRVLPSRAQCAARGGNKPLAQRHRVILLSGPRLKTLATASRTPSRSSAGQSCNGAVFATIQKQPSVSARTAPIV